MVYNDIPRRNYVPETSKFDQRYHVFFICTSCPRIDPVLFQINWRQPRMIQVSSQAPIAFWRCVTTNHKCMAPSSTCTHFKSYPCSRIVASFPALVSSWNTFWTRNGHNARSAFDMILSHVPIYGNTKHQNHMSVHVGRGKGVRLGRITYEKHFGHLDRWVVFVQLDL